MFRLANKATITSCFLAKAQSP